jgi:cobalt-zinc-cadmium efflux system membrane fusion protein
MNLTTTPLRNSLFVLAACVGLAACGDRAGKAAAPAASAASQASAEKPGEHAEGAQELTLSSEEAERAGVKVETVKASAFGDTLTATATIEPDQDRVALVAPRIAGRIISAPAKLGDRVRAGQVLATLDSVEVGEASASLRQAQAELRIAEAELKRIEPLAAEEIIPRKGLITAQADRDKAAAAVRAATDRLRVQGGTPGASGAGASGFAVTAPFAGTVIDKKAVLGTLAGPEAAVFTVADLSRVWIQAALPEAALAKVAVGAKANVTVPAYPGQTFEGRVGYIGAGLDRESRTASARIEVANADGRLKPQMFATARIEVGGNGSADQREVISLPDAAVVLIEGQPNVFVYEQGAYSARQVQAGERSGGRTLISGGLKSGDQVVTSGTYVLKARQQKSQLGHGH